ncbi:MAG: hypothetical protein HY712_02230 [candidate division NC10 bacterium]|nr:hypothetical protein [candidate division NC10 bacterium]
MQLQNTTAPLEDIPADVLILFHLADEPAPRGRLGHVDWILLSALSRLTVRGKFAAERGVSVLLSSGGKLHADWVLVMGLGRRADLTMTALYRLSYLAAETILKLRRTRIVLELPLRGFPTEPPDRIRHAFLEGFLAELTRGRPEASFTVSLLPPEEGRGWAEAEMPRPARPGRHQ